MKIAIFSTHEFEKKFLIAANQHYKNLYQIIFHKKKLTLKTVKLAKDCEVISCFTTDQLDCDILNKLKNLGVKLIALRSAGFDHVDLVAAKTLGLTIARVSDYSPEAIAEFALGLILSLNRHIHRAYYNIKNYNFLLDDFIGYNLSGKKIGVIGTGKIGTAFCKLLTGFNVKLLACDPIENPLCLTMGVEYTTFKTICREADIISLHCPLTADTHYLINRETINLMKSGVMLINTARGSLIDTQALIQALESKKIRAVGLDVYEHEKSLFFRDRSQQIIKDNLFLKLVNFPNVLITGHQAFLTHEALARIAEITLQNIEDFKNSQYNSNFI